LLPGVKESSDKTAYQGQLAIWLTISNQIFDTLDEVMDTVETSLLHLHKAPEELRSLIAFPWIPEQAA
jgi:hypothetical protein